MEWMPSCRRTCPGTLRTAAAADGQGWTNGRCGLDRAADLGAWGRGIDPMPSVAARSGGGRVASGAGQVTQGGSMRKRLNYANLTATLAVFFALSRGAVAVKHYLINSTQQINPKVLKALRGKAGARGASGATGPAGATGPTGGAGATGAIGAT